MSWIHYIWVFIYLALVSIVFILATLKKKKSLPIEENTPFVRRFFVLYIIITLAFAAIIYQLVDIQYAQGEQLRAISQKHFPQADTITAKRGNILSDDGRLLSSSIPYYYLYFDTRVAALHEVNKKTGKTYFDEHVGELAQALAQKFGGKASEQEKKLRKAFRQKKSAYRLHPKAVSYLDYIEIKQFPILKRGAIQGGFSVKERIIRERPFGSLASRTIGGIYGIEGKGKNGLELAYDSLLRGDYGLAIRRKKAGKTVQIITKEPQDGIDVVSTINIDIQETAERALRERLTWSESERGCVVLMEVATGKIKAISNLQWNPSTKQYEEAQNIAVASQIEPGSTFKVFSFAAAIEEKKIDMYKDTYNDKGFEIVGYKPEEVERRFNSLFTAFKYGVPPHGGMAPGMDRIIMLIQDEDNLREVQAFPPNASGADQMMGSPSELTREQLKELGIKIEVKKDE